MINYKDCHRAYTTFQRLCNSNIRVMLTYICNNPGCDIKDIKNHMALPNDDRYRQLTRRLQQEGLISRVPSHIKGFVFFPNKERIEDINSALKQLKYDSIN